MKYKVKVSNWYLGKLPNGKLPVKMDAKGTKIELIGRGDEVITENIQGLENDPRYIIEPVRPGRRRMIPPKEEKEESLTEEV